MEELGGGGWGESEEYLYLAMGFQHTANINILVSHDAQSTQSLPCQISCHWSDRISLQSDNTLKRTSTHRITKRKVSQEDCVYIKHGEAKHARYIIIMIDLYNYGCIPDFEAHSLMEINRLLMLRVADSLF